MDLPHWLSQAQVDILVRYQVVLATLEMVLEMLSDTLNIIAINNPFIPVLTSWATSFDRLFTQVLFGIREYTRELESDFPKKG